MSVFDTYAAQMDTMIFDHMGDSATYTPAVGDSLTVRVIIDNNLQELDNHDIELTDQDVLISIRQSEVSQVSRDDQVSIGNDIYLLKRRIYADTSIVKYIAQKQD